LARTESWSFETWPAGGDLGDATLPETEWRFGSMATPDAVELVRVALKMRLLGSSPDESG
jgi:hypothetical protein